MTSTTISNLLLLLIKVT